jgi:hypothetical protein
MSAILQYGRLCDRPQACVDAGRTRIHYRIIENAVPRVFLPRGVVGVALTFDELSEALVAGFELAAVVNASMCEDAHDYFVSLIEQGKRL